MSKKVGLLLGVVLVLLACAAGAWWVFGRDGAGGKPEVKVEAVQNKYVEISKLIVMLRADPVSVAPHYLAADLVFRTSDAQLAQLKEELPLLRSIAVRSLSELDYAVASSMSIDDFQQRLSVAYLKSFKAEARSQPFSSVMFGKLIIE